MTEIDYPLVSVVVLAYNSADLIEETLNSIKLQSYPNIELIITDDCSTDLTVSVCRKWLELNSERFYKYQLLTATQNSGLSRNVNNGCRICSGEWIKIIAGDDVLIQDCLEVFINYTKTCSSNFIFSQMQTFCRDKQDFKTTIYPSRISINRFNQMSAKEQFNELAIGNCLAAPTSFIKRSALARVGFFDETYVMVEDLPTWLKVTLNQEKMSVVEKITVLYRIHGASITGSISASRNGYFLKVRKGLYNDYIKDNVNFLIKWHIKIKNLITLLEIKVPSCFISYIKLLLLFSPFSYYYLPIKWGLINKLKGNCCAGYSNDKR